MEIVIVIALCLLPFIVAGLWRGLSFKIRNYDWKGEGRDSPSFFSEEFATTAIRAGLLLALFIVYALLMLIFGEHDAKVIAGTLVVVGAVVAFFRLVRKSR